MFLYTCLQRCLLVCKVNIRPEAIMAWKSFGSPDLIPKLLQLYLLWKWCKVIADKRIFIFCVKNASVRLRILHRPEYPHISRVITDTKPWKHDREHQVPPGWMTGPEATPSPLKWLWHYSDLCLGAGARMPEGPWAGKHRVNETNRSRSDTRGRGPPTHYYRAM